MKKKRQNTSRKMVLDIPGIPVGFKTTTAKMMRTDSQWKRYTIYKALVALCFLEKRLSECSVESLKAHIPRESEEKAPIQTKQIFRKDARMHLTEWLGKTINKTDTYLNLPPGVRIYIEELDS